MGQDEKTQRRVSLVDRHEPSGSGRGHRALGGRVGRRGLLRCVRCAVVVVPGALIKVFQGYDKEMDFY